MNRAAETKRQRAPVDVFRYRDYREFLAAYYEQKKQSGLSYRGFAKAAGLGAPNYLKLVIDGQRNLSERMAERFAAACRLNDESTEYFKALVAFNQAKSDAERNRLHERLSRFARFRSSQKLELAQSEYHASWFIPAIRELAACESFVDDPAWIASTMTPPITERQAAHALGVLQKLGLLERERGRLVQASRAVTTGHQASGLHIRNYHKQMMTQAVEAMVAIPAEERYISALTLSASPATMAEVHRRVVEFRKELAALCDADPAPERVLQLNLQLFPLTQKLDRESPGAARAATKRQGSRLAKEPKT